MVSGVRSHSRQDIVVKRCVRPSKRPSFVATGFPRTRRPGHDNATRVTFSSLKFVRLPLSLSLSRDGQKHKNMLDLSTVARWTRNDAGKHLESSIVNGRFDFECVTADCVDLTLVNLRNPR